MSSSEGGESEKEKELEAEPSDVDLDLDGEQTCDKSKLLGLSDLANGAAADHTDDAAALLDEEEKQKAIADKAARSKTCVGIRWVLTGLVLAIFLGCLGGAITLVALSPGCGEITPWWKNTVIYQCYPRSFQDSDGDGNGDLRGVLQRLPYLKEIAGVKTVWLNPVYPSPQMDGGYDISDYTDIDPLYGTLEDMRALIKELHDKGMKLVMDFVPNHTSEQHPWFNESRSSKENPKQDWYVWADGRSGGRPPNNWISLFGGSAWTFDPSRGQYYLHQFSTFQPDLNYRSKAVLEAMRGVLTFWLDLGVDGFRVDAVSYLLEDPDLRDEPKNPEYSGPNCTVNISNPDCYNSLIHNRTKEYPGLHNITRSWRELLNCYSQPSNEKFMVAEVYGSIPTVMEYYGTNGDEFNFPFNFFLLGNNEWSGTAVSALVSDWLDNMPQGGWANWVLGNHDNPRIASKAGVELARPLNVLLLTLPGTPTSYYGEEILMTNVAVPPNQTRDHYAHRDGERTPMQWNVTANAGFTTGDPWLPLATNYTTYNVHLEQQDNASMLALYSRLTQVRAEFVSFNYTLVLAEEGTYAFLRSSYTQVKGSKCYLVVINFSDAKTVDLSVTKAILTEQEAIVYVSSTMDPARERPIELSKVSMLPHEAIIIKANCNYMP